MHNKQSFEDFLKILYILYAVMLVASLNGLLNAIDISTNNLIITYIKDFKIEMLTDVGGFVFQLIFFLFIYIGIHNNIKEIIIFEDEEKQNKLNKKIFPYKIFTGINILYSISVIIFVKEKHFLLPTILVAVSSLLIYYAKLGYLKSYIFNRYNKWLEQCNCDNEDYNYKSIDTKKWRYKIWFNKREKCNLKERRISSINRILTLVITTIFIIASNNILIDIFILYFLIFNIVIIIENTFGLFTSIDGVCTGVLEVSKRNTRNYQNIIVTDYKNKREIKIGLESKFLITEKDKLIVVHGIFSKRLVSINSINVDKDKHISISNIIAIVFMMSVFWPSIGAYFSSNFSYKDEYIDYEEQLKENNPIEIIDKDDSWYKSIINIDEIQTFNNVTIELNRLCIGKDVSKLEFKIKNDSERGLVLNAPYSLHIFSNEGENSNVLMPGNEYKCELDIFENIKKSKYENMVIDLEYTLSETIVHEYLDYSYYNYYPLNVIDNDCRVFINLNTEKVTMEFNEYDQFYNISDEIIEFREI